MRSFSSLILIGAALFVVRPGHSAPVTQDHLLSGAASPKDAYLEASASGARYELRGGAVVELSPGTTFAFEPSIRLKLRKPGDPDTIARSVRVVSGRAEVQIPDRVKDQTAVLLRGPGKLSAVAKEGTAAFATDGDRTTAASRVGEMLVGLGNEWKPLKAGFARTLAPEDPAAQPRPIPAAPQVTPDHRLVVISPEEPGHFTATWSAVKDAATYETSLAREGGGAPVQVGTTSEPRTAFAGLPAGAYGVSVRAVDRYGLASSASAPVTVQILGLDVPDGATVAPDGAIELGREQRVGLVGAKGLEVSYGSSSVFVSAPATLGLAHGAATLVRLRAAGTTEETALRLEPKGLRATVAIGPKIARWPADRVVVDVDLYDTNGRPVPESTKVLPSVTVNLEKVDVSWTRKGTTLHAMLPAGASPGPWVVRAEVTDERGELLGRDFLEVAPASAREGATASR
ncbi:MAG TPA: hypothetical protein VHE30_03855 [Polyangiaceae bacterium]|nr:hypothetical protein [Polyangiaceae bacterium]